MADIRQGFFTTSSQFKKKRRSEMPLLLTSCLLNINPLLIQLWQGQQQATFKPSFKHLYTQLDTLSTEKPKKKQQKQLHEAKEFQASKSEQQEQSDALAMIIAQLSQQVENLKAKTQYAMKLYNNGLTLNQKLRPALRRKSRKQEMKWKTLGNNYRAIREVEKNPRTATAANNNP